MDERVLEVVVAVGATAVGVEFLSRVGLALVQRLTGVYYAPRDAPVLTPAAVTFLTRLLEEGGHGRLMEYSSSLGWVIGSKRTDPIGRMETNSGGVRARCEYTERPEPGITRVTAFGDCLTYGEGLALENTWQHRMEQLDPQLEVLNFGVDGYGLDQCYLRYAESVTRYRYQHVVLIVFVSSNIYKALNAFRPFYAYDRDLKLAKPRFELDGTSLLLRPNPIPALSDYRELLRDPTSTLHRLGRHDSYYQTSYHRGRYDVFATVRLFKLLLHEHRKLRAVTGRDGVYVEGSEALRTTQRLFGLFCETVRRNGSHPLVVLMPTKADVERMRRRATRPWDALRRQFVVQGIAYVDLLDVFAEQDRSRMHLYEGRHLSPGACGVVARELTAAVRRLAPSPTQPSASSAGRPEVHQNLARLHDS